MNKSRDLYLEERLLIEKENDVADEKSRIRLIKEAYEADHSISQRLLNQICEDFHQNEDALFFRQAFDDWREEAMKSFEQIEESQYELQLEERKLQDDLEEIMVQRRKLADEE